MDFDLVWFDSMGAKSSCTRITTPDLSLLIDPGAAAMQPSYPLPGEEKQRLEDRAKQAIMGAARESTHIAITHYHHDHYFTRGRDVDFKRLYGGKTLWVKDPNQWINMSQWDRARAFIKDLQNSFGGEVRRARVRGEYEDPYDDLVLAQARDYGDYQDRREELLGKWRKRFWNTVDHWNQREHVINPRFDGVSMHYADDHEYRVGETTIRFSPPLFHGIEYANTGWVLSIVVEHDGEKLLYTSDLEGPLVEDYAEWIISEEPDVIVGDGPTTYLLGYMFNQINLDRAVENAMWIIRETEPGIMVWDHHLLRDKRFIERTRPVWEHENVYTAAEYEGVEPILEAVV